jgi:hypothetical protein
VAALLEERPSGTLSLLCRPAGAAFRLLPYFCPGFWPGED